MGGVNRDGLICEVAEEGITRGCADKKRMSLDNHRERDPLSPILHIETQINIGGNSKNRPSERKNLSAENMRGSLPERRRLERLPAGSDRGKRLGPKEEKAWARSRGKTGGGAMHPDPWQGARKEGLHRGRVLHREKSSRKKKKISGRRDAITKRMPLILDRHPNTMEN